MGRPRKPYFRTSDKSWVTRFNGRYVKLAKGRGNKAEALKKFHELELAERLSPNHNPANLTVAGVIEAYLVYARTRCAPSTFAQRRQYLQLFAETHGWRLVNTGDCEPLHVSSWLDSHPEWKSDWSRTTITNIVQRPFNWAAKTRFRGLTVNPFRGVESTTGMSRRPMTDDEFAKLLAAIEGKKFKNGPSPADRFREILTFLRRTGARPGEASALKWGNVDLAGGAAVLPEHKTARTQKTPKPRVIVFDEEVKALLSAIRDRGDPGDHVFLTYRLTPWHRSTLSQRIVRARRKAKIPDDVKLYGLRHAFGTRAITSGVDLKTAAELMGHTSTRMTEVYVHLAGQRAHLAAAMRRVNAPGPGA
jgi:integrase